MKIRDHSLYLVITEEYGKGRSAVEIAAAAIAGGVDIIQMREKDRPRSELLAKGKELLAICGARDIPLIINDDPELAAEIGADGVHLGRGDLIKFPVKAVREMLGRDKIIGVSTHSLAQFREAQGWDVDYLAFGPVFPTKTKDYSIGTSNIRAVALSDEKSVFFIGGIDLSNVDSILAEGARRIALIRAIAGSEDICGAAGHFKKKLSGQKIGGGTMNIRINGKPETVTGAANIEQLVSQRMLSPEKIVVEHNLRIVSKDEWPGTALKENDAVEIISFVGGG